MSYNACEELMPTKLKPILAFAIIAIILTTITTATATANTLEITNLSGKTYTFTEQQLKEMPQTTITAALYCYGSLVTSGAWSGVQFNYLLTQTNVNSEVHSIQLLASDGYTVTLPIELAVAPNTIIAYQKDGEPLDGLRLVLPGYNGASWINLITTINMSSIEAHTPATETEVWTNSNPGTITNYKQPFPTPTLTSKPTQTTPKPTPNNTTFNPTVPPTNVTDSNQIPQQQTTTNQPIELDPSFLAVIATVFTLGLSTAIILTYRRRNRLKITSTQLLIKGSFAPFSFFDSMPLKDV
jgi:hypothetical protein